MSKMISYKKLWKLLIDRNMSKSQLKTVAGVSTASIAKLGKGENITTGVLIKICEGLQCDLVDIMELIDDDKNNFYETVGDSVKDCKEVENVDR